jgi:hypothetical protein
VPPRKTPEPAPEDTNDASNEVDLPAVETLVFVADGPAKMARKIAEIILAVSHVEKGGRNDFHKYDYATEADVLAAVRREMAQRQLVVIPEVVRTKTRPPNKADGEKDFIAEVDLFFHLIDGETGHERSVAFTGWGLDRGEKAGYKGITGATKYFLLKLFLLPTGDDPERDDSNPSPAPARTAPAPAAGRSPTSPRSDAITSAQVSMLWAKSREMQLTETEVYEAVKVKAAVEHIHDIPKAKVDAVLLGLEQYAAWKKSEAAKLPPTPAAKAEEPS